MNTYKRGEKYLVVEKINNTVYIGSFKASSAKEAETMHKEALKEKLYKPFGKY